MSSNRSTLTALVWERCPSKYSGTALVVLAKLAGLTNDEGYAYPSVMYLAKSSGVCMRSVQKITKMLKKDGVLKIGRGIGGRNRFFLQVDEIAKLPLAVPRDYRNEPEVEESPEAETATPAEQSEALRFAIQLEKVIRRDIADALIPDNWASTWPTEIQKLFDVGHDFSLLVKVARFALGHAGFSSLNLGPHGAKGFVDHFDAIHRLYNESQKEKAAA